VKDMKTLKETSLRKLFFQGLHGVKPSYLHTFIVFITFNVSFCDSSHR